MIELLYPDEYVKSIYTIDYKMLYADGIDRLIFDIDNTITPYDVPHPSEKIMKFFEKLKKVGFKVCLVSNNKEKRVKLFNERLGLPYVFKAGKPKLTGLRKAMTLIDGNNYNTAFIGDQVFTDVFCGNRQGIYTILVKPVTNRDEFSVRLKRGVEKLVVNQYLKERNIPF